jgi:hypothetical protein
MGRKQGPKRNMSKRLPLQRSQLAESGFKANKAENVFKRAGG